jgi:hypothetical protein
MAERLHDTQEVVGPIPTGATNLGEFMSQWYCSCTKYTERKEAVTISRLVDEEYLRVHYTVKYINGKARLHVCRCLGPSKLTWKIRSKSNFYTFKNRLTASQ